jgi:glycosyltransferase involved in cell wall biosynthesis
VTKHFTPDDLWQDRADEPSLAARHIAIVVHSLNGGGAQRRLVTLANAFAEAGRRVDFVALRGGGDVDALLDPCVRRTVLTQRPKPRWKPWFFEGWGSLRTWLAEQRPDVVLAGVTTVHFPALVARGSAARGRPLLAMRASRHPHRHFPWSRPFKRLFEPLERWARWRIYRAADLVMAVSRETAEALQGRLDRPETCVEVANPVITSTFVESLSHEPAHDWLNDGAPVIVAAGRLAWQKRFDVLLEALATVRKHRDVRLIILGEGRLRRRLEGHVRRLGLCGAVCMPGNVRNVGTWLANAELLVSTSAFEGSPAVLIEALAAGIPVVATRCPGGSVELLESRAGGTLIPTDDPDATALAILDLLEAPRNRAALKRLADRYTVEASAAAYLGFLDQAIAERRAPATPKRRGVRQRGARQSGARELRRRAVQQI